MRFHTRSILLRLGACWPGARPRSRASAWESSFPFHVHHPLEARWSWRRSMSNARSLISAGSARLGCDDGHHRRWDLNVLAAAEGRVELLARGQDIRQLKSGPVIGHIPMQHVYCHDRFKPWPPPAPQGRMLDQVTINSFPTSYRGLRRFSRCRLPARAQSASATSSPRLFQEATAKRLRPSRGRA